MATLIEGKQFNGLYSSRGSFYVNDKLAPESCRVSFHHGYRSLQKYSPIRGFYYSLKYDQNINQIINILTKIENKIHLPEEHCLKICNCNKAIYVQTSAWWDDPIRLTLLTILLRDIKFDSLAECINRGQYLKKTKKAFYKFLSGYVNYQGQKYEGWMRCFSGKFNESMLKKEPLPVEKRIIKVEHHQGWGYTDQTLIAVEIH